MPSPYNPNWFIWCGQSAEELDWYSFAALNDYAEADQQVLELMDAMLLAHLKESANTAAP